MFFIHLHRMNYGTRLTTHFQREIFLPMMTYREEYSVDALSSLGEIKRRSQSLELQQNNSRPIQRKLHLLTSVDKLQGGHIVSLNSWHAAAVITATCLVLSV